MTTPMLPGLGGGTGGVQLSSATPLTTPKIVPTSGSVDVSTTAASTNKNAPLLSAPGAVQPSTTAPLPTVNPNASFQNTVGGAAGTPLQTAQPQQSVTQMLNNPNLITSSSTDLAAKYGTMGTAPTDAADTAAKYNAAHAAVKGSTAPTSGGDARSAVDDALAKTETPKEDPQQQFMDGYSSLNPVEKQLFDDVSHALSAPATQETYAEEFKRLSADKDLAAGVTGETISDEKLKLMNIKNLMDGTRDDIANEITKAGGFATESQIDQLVATRNKVLQKQASALQDSINAKEDYVTQMMKFTQMDRAEATAAVDKKLGLEEKMVELQDKMDTAATANYEKTLTNLGGDYTAFATTVPPNLQPKVEKLMGLAPGTLSNKDELAYLTASSLKQQQLAQSSQRLQIQVSNAGSMNDLRQAQTDLAHVRAMSLEANTTNSTIKSMYGSSVQTNPILAYRTAANWFGNVNAAYAKSTDPTNSNKGASDLELMDAAVKLNNGGQQITEAQLAYLTHSISLPGKFVVEGGKITGYSGVLDSGTRAAIRDLATSNILQKKMSAIAATTNINETLSKRGVASNMTLPDVTANMVPEGATNYGTIDGTGVVVYSMPDGSNLGSDGQIYDNNGNPI